MADYDPVTVEEFLNRFPAFASTDEVVLAAVLGEAQAVVDDSWTPADFRSATMYLMAHLLTAEAGASANAGSSGVIVSESFGPMSRTYANLAAAGGNASLTTTEYGRRFREIQRRNFPGIAVA